MELLQSLIETEQDGRDKQDELNPANPRESLFIGSVHDFINTVTYSRENPGRPGKGAGSLAGGERSEPPALKFVSFTFQSTRGPSRGEIVKC